MDELFGVSMNRIMGVLLVIFLVTMVIIVIMAWRNRVMLKLGLRNIPRRRAQTVLIIIGIMLSSVITAAAFGTGDTITHSIRKNAVEALGNIDEIVVSNRAASDDSFGTNPYIPYERFRQLRTELAGVEAVDGIVPMIGETVPGYNPGTRLGVGQTNVVGIDPEFVGAFGSLTSISGSVVLLTELAADEVYISDKAAEELGAIAGHELKLFVAGDTHTFTVREVVERGGLAGAPWESTVLMPLDTAQRVFNRADQINTIVVSNRGGEIAGAEHSEEVTRRLRVLFADRPVASELKTLLSGEPVLKAIEARQETLSGTIEEDIASLLEELQSDQVSDQLISLLSDRDVSSEVLDALGEADLRELEGQADTLFEDLAEFRVFDIKRLVLDFADVAGSVTTTLFVVMALFSILIGILLIFLIFVMLAAARRSELGMARAIGAKRSHLVMMFVFEGTAYALVAAAVGVLLGWGLSTLMVGVLNWIISGFDIDFSLSPLFKPRSAIVAYCLGMVITFATAGFSAYRVSRMNIVQAVRGLPENLVLSGEAPIMTRLLGILRGVGRPGIFLFRAFIALTRGRFSRSTVNLGLTIVWVLIFPIWIVDVAASAVRFLWPYVLRGWLTLLLGLLIVHLGVSAERDSIFAMGASLMVIGLGLMGRKALQLTPLRPDLRDRAAFTFTGVLMLVFWVLPVGTFEGLTGPLAGDIEMMFVAGIFMVTAAVWTVMYNADLLLRALTHVTGRIGSLRPVLVIAVAYPMSSKFRTGLTLLMFGLVTFTLVVMSVLVESFGNSIASDLETVTGRWDIQGSVNFNTPIEDIRGAIEQRPELAIGDFEAIGGYTQVPVEARQVGVENRRWKQYAVWAADDDFLDASEFKLKLIADRYDSEKEVWKALKEDASLTVVEGYVVPTVRGNESDFTGFQLQGVFYEDDRMAPLSIEVREPLTGVVIPLTVIGVLDRVHDPFELGAGMLTSKGALDDEIPFAIPVTTYNFRLAEGVGAKEASRKLEASLREFGMETEVLEDELKRGVAGFRAFYYLLIGFMGLGLVVAIAGLGVISTRAVVERRQQIGVLRAIGYRRRMVELSFLLESSFVALLGIFIGVVLGAALSYNAIKDIRTEEGLDTLKYSVPWVQVLIIVVVAYLFSLAMTYLPARQAARTLPAEALRYE